jgi:hypothetical protein
MLDSIAKYSKVLGSEKSQAIIKQVDQYKKAIAKAYNRLDAMKTKVNNWLKEQVEAITKGSHKAEQRGATGTTGNKVNNQRVLTLSAHLNTSCILPSSNCFLKSRSHETQ